MRRRLVTSTAAIALASVLVLGIPLGVVESARVRSEENSRLEREADAVAGAIDDRLEEHAALNPAQLDRYVPDGHRVVIVTRDGRRLTIGPPIGGDVIRARAGSPRGATVVAEAPAAEVHERALHAWLLIAALAAAGVAAAATLAALQARRLARPLESLAASSARLADGDFSARAGRFDIPEVDALAYVFDVSAERIARLVAREREFSANVSHQLRTPLTALRLRVEELSLNPPTADAREEIEAALHELDRLERTIADLLAYARRERAADAVVLDLAEMTHRHAKTWEVLFRGVGRQLDVRVEPSVSVRASPGSLGQVLDVLLENALQHGAGRVTVIVSSSGRHASLTVEDEGRGVPAEEVEEIFDRGASTGGGTGIGLHLAQVLMAAEGGELRLARPVPPRFEFVLPLAGAARTERQPTPAGGAGDV